MLKKIFFLVAIVVLSLDASADIYVDSLDRDSDMNRFGVLSVEAIEQQGQMGRILVRADRTAQTNAIRIISVIKINPNATRNEEKLMACEPANRSMEKQVNWILPGNGYQFREYIVHKSEQRRRGPILDHDRLAGLNPVKRQPCSVENARRLLERLKRHNVYPNSTALVRGVLPVSKILRYR